MNKKRFLRLVSLMLILAMTLPMAGAYADIITSNGQKVTLYYKDSDTEIFSSQIIDNVSAKLEGDRYYFTAKHPLGGPGEVWVSASQVEVVATPEPTAMPLPTSTATLKPGVTPTPPPPSLEGNTDAEYTGRVLTYKVVGTSFWLYDNYIYGENASAKQVLNATTGTTLTLTEVVVDGTFTGWYSTWYKNSKYYVPASSLEQEIVPGTTLAPWFGPNKAVSVRVQGEPVLNDNKEPVVDENGKPKYYPVQLYTDINLKNKASLQLESGQVYNVTYVTYVNKTVLEYKAGGVSYYFDAKYITMVSDATIGGTNVSYVTELETKQGTKNEEPVKPRVYEDMRTDSKATYLDAGVKLFAARVSNDWYQVIYQDKTRYVRANDIGIEGDDDFDKKTFKKVGQTAVSGSIVGNTKMVTIGANGAKVYEKPDEKTECVATLNPGENIMAAVYNNAWYVYSRYIMRRDGTTETADYYIPAKYVASSNATEDIGFLKVYLAKGTKLYVTPSTNSRPDQDQRLSRSDYYVVKSYDYDWYSIEYDGKTYYVQKKEAGQEKVRYLTIKLPEKGSVLKLYDEKMENPIGTIPQNPAEATYPYETTIEVAVYGGENEKIYGIYKDTYYIRKEDVDELALQDSVIGEENVSGTTGGRAYMIVIANHGAQVYQDALLTVPTNVTLNPGTRVQATQHTPTVFKVSSGFVSINDVASIVGGDDYNVGGNDSVPGGSVDDIHTGSTDGNFSGEVLTYTVPAGGLWLYKDTNETKSDISLNQGRTVNLTKVDGDWYSIYYGGSVYYVSLKDLKRDPDAPNKPGVFSIVVKAGTKVYAKVYTDKELEKSPAPIRTVNKDTRVNVKVAATDAKKNPTWYAYMDEKGANVVGYFQAFLKDAEGTQTPQVDSNTEWNALVSNGANANFVYVITLKAGDDRVRLYHEADEKGVYTPIDRVDKKGKEVKLLAAIYDSKWYKVDYNGFAYYLLRKDVTAENTQVDHVTTGNGAASSTLKVTIGPNGATLYKQPIIPKDDKYKHIYYRDQPDGEAGKYDPGEEVTLPAGSVVSANVYSGSWYSYAMENKTYYFQNNVVVDSNTSGTATSYRFTIPKNSGFVIQLHSWPSGVNSLGKEYQLTESNGNDGTHVARKTNAGWWETSFNGKTCYFKDEALDELKELLNSEEIGDYIGTTTVGRTYNITIKDKVGGAVVYSNVLLTGATVSRLPAGYRISAIKRMNSAGAYAYEVQIGGTVGYINANDVASINGSDEINESINAGQPNNSDVAVGASVTVSLPAGTKLYEYALADAKFQFTLPEALNDVSALKRYPGWYQITYNGTRYYFESAVVEKGGSSSGTTSGITGGKTEVPTGSTVKATLKAGTKVYLYASTQFGDPVTVEEDWTGTLTKVYDGWYRFTYTDGNSYNVQAEVVEGASGGNVNVNGSNTLPIGSSKKFTVPAGTRIYYYAAVNYGSFPLTAKLETTVTKAYADWYSFTYEGQKVYIQATVVEGNSVNIGGNSGSDNALGLDVGVGEKTTFTFKNATKAYSAKDTSSYYTTLQAGAAYTLIREDPDWYMVETGANMYYFVPAESVTTQTGTTGGTTKPNNPTTDGTGIITPMLLVSPSTGSVNLRKQASTGSTVLDRVPKGAQVRNLGYTKDVNGQLWYKVTYNGRTGYMLGTYVKAVGTGGSTDGGTVIDPSQDIGRTLTVNTENVNVRSGAGMTFSVLGKIAKGVSITPTEVKQDNEGQYWYRFQYTPSAYGYIRGDYLTGSAVNNTVQSGNVAIKAGGTNLRSGAGTMFGVRAKLERDTIVTVLGTGTDTDGELWYRVTYNGLSGYVRHDLVRPLSASESEGLISGVVGTYVELRYGSKGDAVRSLQVQLISIGYLAPGEADGSYGPKTMAAVQAFQKANGLTPNGVATPATQAKLFNTPPTSSGSTTSLDWFSTGYDLINKYPNISVYDINTGVSWNAKYINGTKHADVVPASQADANKLVAYKITGDYHRRPVIVTINGSKYAGSMYAVGHGNTNYVSWFSGVMCIHFTGSMTHGSQVVDKDHQQAIQDALNSGL